MGIKGVVLEYQADPTVLCGKIRYVLVSEEDFSGGGGLQSADHVKGRALAAAGGPQQSHQLPIRDLVSKVVHGDHLAALLFVSVGESLGQVL